MAGVFVEDGAIRAGRIALPVIKNAPFSLTFPFGSFWLRCHALYFFGIFLPLLLWVATGEEAEQNQQNNGWGAHVPG